MNPSPEVSPESSPSRSRAAILVLGVARSGTSLLAHLLNILGGKLPEQLLGAGRGNPLGHWEPMRILELDDEILRKLGRTFHDPGPIPPNWFRSKEAYHFEERISKEIVSSYGDASLLLIKEPRICRLAPLYLDALDALGIEPLIILLVRHPVEVMQSFQKRDGGDMRTHELRWLRHLIESEEASRTCRRVWTSFDQVLDKWQETTQSIAQGLGINWPNEPELVAAEMTKIVRKRHRHFQITHDPAPVALGPLATRAWQAVGHALDGDETSARALFDELRIAINELDRLNLPERECLETRLGTAEVRCRTIEELLAQANTALAEADTRCHDANLQRQEFAAQTAQLRGALAERESTDVRLEQLAAQIAQLRGALPERESTGEERATRISQLQEALCETQSQGERLVQQLRAQLTEQVNQSTQLKGQIDSIRASICWRLTWPIRWLHRQAGGILSKARFPAENKTS
jgi:hypothetical protein